MKAMIAQKLAEISERPRFIRRDRRTADQSFENGERIDLGGTGHGDELSRKQDARPQWPYLRVPNRCLRRERIGPVLIGTRGTPENAKLD